MSADRSKIKGSPDETQHPDEDDKSSNKPGAKPRASRAGTRSVSTLNAEQLARKRANDREAQRAIRQRTKEHIERLEQRIQELTGNGDGDLERNPAYEEARRRNSELEEELRRLQATLYASEERPSSPDTAYSDTGYATPVGEPSPYAGAWSAQNVSAGIAGFAPTSAPVSRQNPTWAPGHPQYTGYVQQPSNTTAASPYNSEPVADAGNLPYQADQLRSFGGTAPNHLASQRLPFRGTRTDYLWSASDPPAGIGQSQMAHTPPPAIHTITPAFPGQTSQPLWELPVQFSPPTCPTGTLLNSTIQQLRDLRGQGVVGAGLIGHAQPNLGPIIQPGYSNPVHGLIRTISEFVNSIPFPRLVEKVGSMVVMYPTFQWLIANSYETYTNLPECLLPQQSQLHTPHPVWVSLIIWPRLRDEIINNQERYATPEMEYIYGVSLTLNWPYQPQDAVERLGEEWRATEAFVRQARELGNWGLGEVFQRRYPELRDACQFLE